MSFMFNPVDFDDQGAINRISLDEETAASIVSGTGESAVYISELLSDLTSEKERPVIAVFDGYIGALWEQSLKLVTENLESVSVKVIPEDFRKVFKSSDLLDELFKGHLPSDREKDPVLLFGKLFKGTYDDILDDQKTDELIARLRVHRNSGGAGKVILVYGCGSAIKRVRQLADYVFYLDVAPKNVILRARKGLFANLGDTAPRGIDEFIRRCYYVDYEIASRHRGELLTGSHIDFYIDGNDLSDLKMMPRRAFDSIMSALVRYPVRCKPVYLEGV